MDAFDKLQQAVDYLQNRIQLKPVVGIVLGSGLGDFVKEIKVQQEIEYKEVPNFPLSTVLGHQGKLIFGTINDKPVMAMAGRFHYYEGYSGEEVVFPVRVMKMLGVKTILLSNAAGATNEDFKVGDLMIITDHISMSMPNPLIGKNDDRFGTRFPDMSDPYNAGLIANALSIARKKGIDIKQGFMLGNFLVK